MVKQAVQLVLGVIAVLFLIHFGSLLLQTDATIAPKVKTSGSIMEMVRSTSEYQLGVKKLNFAFVKYMIGAVVSALFAVTFLTGAFASKRSTNRRQPVRNGSRLRYSQRPRERRPVAAGRDAKPALTINAQYQDYMVGFDTNVLLDRPDILTDVSQTNAIIIAAQVVDELDRKKKDALLGPSASKAFWLLDTLQAANKLSVVQITPNAQLGFDLDTSKPDQKIIAAYRSEQLRQNRRVLFISQDRGAKLFAREAGLEVLG